MAIARHKTRQRELREARALIRRAQRGDRGAFGLLYTAYEGRIYGFCHRLTGDPVIAAALTELTFVRALADLPADGLDSLDVVAYLHATARALAYERTGEPPGSPSAAGDDVAAANLRLSPQERAVLALRDLEGRPDTEVAGVFGVEEAAVPGLVGTARLHLLAELRPPGLAPACSGRLPELSAYADGTLEPAARAELEQHVAGCAYCRAALFGLREASLRYRALPVPEPPGELGSRIATALGAVGLPLGKPAVEDPAASGPQTAAAVALAVLAIAGVGVTIAAARNHHDRAKPAPAPSPAPPQPEAVPAPQAPGSPLAAGSAGGRAVRPLAAPPQLRHLRAGPRRVVAARRPRPNPAAGLGRSFAPESPPASPPAATAPPPAAVPAAKPERRIPVEIVPPATPSSAQAASSPPPPPPDPPPPPPPAQTTTT